MRDSRRFTVNVTDSDIAEATRTNECVVVLAITRAIPDATRIAVGYDTVRFTQNEKRLVYRTPYAVQGYVVAFDAGDKIGPFSFRLPEDKGEQRS